MDQKEIKYLPFPFRWEKDVTLQSVMETEAVLATLSLTMTSGTGSKPRERGHHLATLQPHVSLEVLAVPEAPEIRNIRTEQTEILDPGTGSQKARNKSPGTSPGQVTLICQQVPRPQHQLRQQRLRSLPSSVEFQKLTRVANGPAKPKNHERNPIPKDLARHRKFGRNCGSRPSSVEHTC